MLLVCVHIVAIDSLFCRPEDHLDYVLSALEDSSTAKEYVSEKRSCTRPLPKEEEAAVGMVMESLVSQVKDLLPHLGTGFIEVRSQHKCKEWCAICCAMVCYLDLSARVRKQPRDCDQQCP